MNIFTKAKLIKLLEDKIQSGEIHSYLLTDSYIRIVKSKRTGFTFKLKDFSDSSLLKILKRTTPNPSVQNINDFYQYQIKNL